MIEAYKNFWKNYFNFKDRTTRSGYWYVILMNLIIGFILGFISGFLSVSSNGASSFIMILISLYCLASIIPSIALFVRRLHDINKSGWWYFIALVPFVGSIILLVFLCTASVDENNKYGEKV